MDNDLVRLELLWGHEVTIPREVQAAAVGDSDSSDKNGRRLGDFLSLTIMGQAWEDESLLKNKEIKTTFEKWKRVICKAIKEKNHFPFQHMAEAMEYAQKGSPDCKMAIARAFILLRLRHDNGQIPTDELKKEARRPLLQWEILRSDGSIKEPHWSREFDELGIRPFLIKEKPGRKPRKPN